MALFDVHAHLTDRRLAADEAGVLARAAAAGVGTIISNGLNPEDNAAVAALASRSPLVKPAFGLYPVDAILPELLASGHSYPRDTEGEPPDFDACYADLERRIEGAFAMGEVGLDHYWVPEALWALQEERFRRLVRLALAADKPLIVHTRKAEARALDVLLEEGAQRVVWHCFSAKVKLGERIAAAGHWLSIPANAHKAENFRQLLAKLPRDKVLLETDCPYLGPEKGALNEPANVAGTAALAAELWGASREGALAQLEANFDGVFRAAP